MNSISKTLLIIVCVDILVLVGVKYYDIYQGRSFPGVVTTPNPIGVSAQKEGGDLPVRLKIPAIHVDSTIVPVGVEPDGIIETPGSTTEVGWFSLGTRPGDIGSAVLTGHFNGENNRDGVFLNLSELRHGDLVLIENELGIVTTFTVREVHTYSPGYIDDIFNWGDGAHLNLITCDGIWDPTLKSFSKRLVVFTDKVD